MRKIKENRERCGFILIEKRSNRMRSTQRKKVMFCQTRLCALALAAALLPSNPFNPSNASAQSCVGNPVAVQILGSGGPRINGERASASYLLWVDAQAKILVDIGGGTFFRFGQSRARLGDLSMVAISHLHPDHVSDLPALLWTSNQLRNDPLPIFGPSGNDAAPDFSTFLHRLFDAKTGAFQVLGPTLGATQGNAGGGVRLEVGVVDVTKAEPSTVFDRDGVAVTALGIPHGNLPTLAYRVRTRGVSIVFSSDQTGTNPNFVDFAKGANVLIMHLAIAAGATSPLHAAPAVVGRVAKDAGVGRLIVSHIGQFALDPAIAELKKFYTGPLTVGADLQCTPVQ
jgi:ribonuclease BN (tRNA processing enzyme)